MNTTEQTDFDIAIIGSGVGGSSLAAILARHGQRVIVFEAKSHPRFAIGESMILETSETMRALAELFDVPELAYFSSEHYLPLVGSSHGVKRHFSYLHHSAGAVQDKTKSLQAVIPKEPHGHELHLFRQDVDAFLTTVAISYGATVWQNTAVHDVAFLEAKVLVHSNRETVSARYLVDAGGFKSPLADKFDLRDFDLQTHSRAIFTHMVKVPDFHDVSLSSKDYGIPFSVAEGTLHHIFEGGWLWVIPFNNHDKATNPLCSIGLMLDPRVYPVQESLSPEEEFYDFIKCFPSIHKQLEHAKAVRDWTRTGRIQYSSKQIVGERWALLGHAAGFIDPLFSKGLYVTHMSLAVLAHLLLEAAQDDNYSAQKFQPLEDTTLAYIRANDRLIANSYKSFSNYKLWTVYSALWLLGAYTELVKLMSMRAQAKTRHEYFKEAQTLHLVGGGFAAFREIADKIDVLLEQVNPHDEAEVDKTVQEIQTLFATLKWMPEAFKAILRGKNHLPKRKLRLNLLREDQGFLGTGSYREHFFGRTTTSTLVKTFIKEKLRYSPLALQCSKRRSQF